MRSSSLILTNSRLGILNSTKKGWAFLRARSIGSGTSSGRYTSETITDLLSADHAISDPRIAIGASSKTSLAPVIASTSWYWRMLVWPPSGTGRRVNHFMYWSSYSLHVLETWTASV